MRDDDEVAHAGSEWMLDVDSESSRRLGLRPSEVAPMALPMLGEARSLAHCQPSR